MPAVAASLNITSRLLRLSIACAAVFAGGLLASAQSLDPAQRLDPSPLAEVRALWVTRASLTTPAAIEGLVSSARASGFNTLVVQVRGRGDAYFASSLEPRADLFSLGTLLYEAATAVSPFQQATPVATMTRVCTHQHPPAHEVEPAVPVALNSGLFWGRRAFRKEPGRIIVEYLPPIAPGLAKREFLGRLEDTIEQASARLEAESVAGDQ